MTRITRTLRRVRRALLPDPFAAALAAIDRAEAHATAADRTLLFLSAALDTLDVAAHR